MCAPGQLRHVTSRHDCDVCLLSRYKVDLGGLARADPSWHTCSWVQCLCADNGLTGTKLGCGEGGCGACTVMLSRKCAPDAPVKHMAVNACLCPLYAAAGCHVITVEGIGNPRDGLHPVQVRSCCAAPQPAMCWVRMMRSPASVADFCKSCHEAALHMHTFVAPCKITMAYCSVSICHVH